MMIISYLKSISIFLRIQFRNFSLFYNFLFFYAKKKTNTGIVYFEKQKDILVKFLLMKRGRYNRPFLHITTMAILGLGVLFAPFLADTYPIFSGKAAAVDRLPTEISQEQSITADQNVFSTDISQKPRDKVVDYTVQRGDTISTIAEKFGISTDTIRWENDLTGDSITVGDSLKILPVTGISYKVQSGDTIYSIAKKFGVDAQKIANWPFNDYANPETFSLVVGQILIVPDGIEPSARPSAPTVTYYAQKVAHSDVVSSGGFSWPMVGGISQYPVWYHMALDITNPIGTPIKATKNGKVISVEVGGWNYGYGTNVVVDHGDGITSLYAHMSAVAVSAGQDVVGGQTVIGYVGVTGHTTGPHLHFEIRRSGVTTNPLSYLP